MLSACPPHVQTKPREPAAHGRSTKTFPARRTDSPRDKVRLRRVATGNPFLQVNPWPECVRCRAVLRCLRCYDPRCSVASKQNWSWKYATLAYRRLVEVAAQGRLLVQGTLRFPPGVGLVEVSRIIARFRSAISAANRKRADLKYVAVLHARGRRGGTAHLHVLIHTGRTTPEVKATLRAAWWTATGQNQPLHCAPIRRPMALARYVFGDTAEHRRNPRLLKRGGPPAKVSNRFFDAGGERKAWRDFCAARHKPSDAGAPPIELFGPLRR
jgi:hypothetical protein